MLDLGRFCLFLCLLYFFKMFRLSIRGKWFFYMRKNVVKKKLRKNFHGVHDCLNPLSPHENQEIG